jgi:hypothetical protein
MIGAKPKNPPSDAAVERFAFENTAKILLCRRTLVRMNKVKEGLPDEQAGLGLQVALEDRVQIDKVQPGRQECPVCGWKVF